MQLTGQTASHAPQSMQSSALMNRFSPTSEIHSTGQTGSQAPQLMHSSLLITLGMVSSFVDVLSKHRIHFVGLERPSHSRPTIF
jgi:hypothetical protein